MDLENYRGCNGSVLYEKDVLKLYQARIDSRE